METGKVMIHGKEYETVASRVQKFKTEYPKNSLVTALVSRDEDYVVMLAEIRDESDRLMARGHAEERRDSSSINKTSALENCETSAIGRALAAFGLGGTEFATADEVANAISQQNTPAKQPAKKTETKKQTPPKDPAKWMTNWLKEAAKLKILLGEDKYRKILSDHNYKKANEVRNRTDAEKIWTAMTVALDAPTTNSNTTYLCPKKLDGNGNPTAVLALDCSKCEKREGCPARE